MLMALNGLSRADVKLLTC